MAVLAEIGSVSKNTANGNAPVKNPLFYTVPKRQSPLTLEFLEVTSGIMFSAPQANYEIVTEIDSGAACNIALKTRDIADNAG